MIHPVQIVSTLIFFPLSCSDFSCLHHCLEDRKSKKSTAHSYNLFWSVFGRYHVPTSRTAVPV